MVPQPTFLMACAVYLGWLISLASIASSVAARTSKRFAKWVSNIPLSTWSFTTIVLALGTYALILSQQLGGIVEPRLGVPVVDSIVRTIRCFSADDDVELVGEMVHRYFAPGIDRLYLFTNSLAHLAAPVDTLMGIFILVTKFFSTPILRARAKSHDTYVFSRLNAQSLRMAQNIAQHYKKTSSLRETESCLIAFAKTADMENDSLYSEAITHGMICLDQPASSVSRFLGESEARRVYVFSDESELANLEEGTRFVREFVEHDKRKGEHERKGTPEVQILSTAPVSESFIDAATADAIVPWANRRRPIVSVRRADWARNTIETLLWRVPLFLTTHPSKDETAEENRSLYHLDRRRVVIVGGGTIGYEFLKAAIWCAQLGDIHFTFDVIDLNASGIRQKLAYDAPEISRLNGVGEGMEYHINFLGIDALTGSYLDHLREHRDSITYVMIALGNDLANVRVARRTREVLEQSRYLGSAERIRSAQPLVACIVSDGALASSVEEMKTGNGISYDIVTVGSYERIFSFANMFRFELDRLGRNVNRAYWGCYDGVLSEDDLKGLRASADAEYERLEYNRRSSRSSAIHLKYDLYAYIRREQLFDETAAVPALTWQMDFYSEKDGKPTELAEVAARYDQHVLQAIEGEQSMAASDLEWMSRIEHDRWDAYMRTEGYECADETTFASFLPHTHENQNRLAKQHVCLVPFDQLDEVSAFAYAGTHKDRDRDYKKADDNIVQHVGDIMRDMNE